MWNKAVYLKVPHGELKKKGIWHGDLTGRFAYFRCEMYLPKDSTLTLDITANSRYRLWVNEQAVLSGPCKGDRFRQYYETVDLTPYLREGENAFCVQVLYCDPDAVERQTDERAAIYGVMGRQCGHRLAVEGVVRSVAGARVASLTTGEADWRVFLDNSFYLTSTEITQFLGAVEEHIDTRRSPMDWKKLSFDASSWVRAEAAGFVAGEDPLYAAGVQPMFRLREREIPLLYEKERLFERCFGPDGKDCSPKNENSTLVRAGETCTFFWDAGAVVNGHPRFAFSGGQEAGVEIVYFEKFGGPGSDLVRTDISGEVVGLTDSLVLSGANLCYEPFWVRCFRFIRVTVTAGGEDVLVYDPVYRQTGYPLPVETEIHSSTPWVEQLWDICVRTLTNCMMETFMDCPYYEQLQFAMDTRLEALFTYAVSSDSALVRKALLDFHYGVQPEGLMCGKYPSAYLQILSTFSLHYIFMLREYAGQGGDREIVRICRNDVDRILSYYDNWIGEDGMVGHLGFWEFVDWNPAWDATVGMPAAIKAGASTIINLMYAYALRDAAALMEAAGRKGLAEEYRTRREAVLTAVKKNCWDERAGMFREGPAFHQFSRHAQAWAVLNGLVEGEEAAEVLRRAIGREDCLTCSFSTSYEWFRALAKAGLYEELRADLEPWIGLLSLGCTTCPETPTGARSDCHAWSALPIYEFVHTMAGITLEADGSLTAAPHLFELPDMWGRIVTKCGMVTFDYRKDRDGRWVYYLSLPAGVSGRFVFEDGESAALRPGANRICAGSGEK